MRVTGYRLKGYDATYEHTVFDVKIHNKPDSCVLEVADDASGIAFIFEIPDSVDKTWVKKGKSKGNRS